VGGLNRHDTLDDGHDSTYTFDDESDDIPLRTELRYYHLKDLRVIPRGLWS
jgi:hypothetical protein